MNRRFFAYAIAALMLAALSNSLFRGMRLALTSFGAGAPRAASAGGLYDPSRDAAQDLRDAAARAKAERKRVLVEVGGNWCAWCRRMELFLNANPDLAALRDRGFVVVRVSVGDGTDNSAALARFPAIPGYPHLFVLDENGELIRSQATSELESGDSYDRDRFRAFLESAGQKL